MKTIIGRAEELAVLRKMADSNQSEFVAIYGRRRVGKTFLVRSAYHEQFTFQVTGLGNATTSQQLTNFYLALRYTWPDVTIEPPADWLTAFQSLIQLVGQSDDKRKILFMDELPWFDTPRSGFVQALEHFWNGWASARSDITLVVCGSAASWMINTLINNHGGLYNRVTRRIRLMPFTLRECELYLRSKHSVLDRYQIVQLYMVLGGIPFYWDEVDPNRSALENIREICFRENGLLRSEYTHLYRSLFVTDGNHQAIVEALAGKSRGLSRKEIIRATGLADAGSTTRVIKELEESGFIKRYKPFGGKIRNSIYQLVDLYSLFFLRFIKDVESDTTTNWLLMADHPRYRTWCGYAFEQVCLCHASEIKAALGIAGVQTTESSWRSSRPEGGAQIDLLIDRRDHVITLCEMKYSINPYTITKKYALELREKINRFQQETGTRKTVFLAMVTTFGITPNEHSIGLVQNDLALDSLFR